MPKIFILLVLVIINGCNSTDQATNSENTTSNKSKAEPRKTNSKQKIPRIDSTTLAQYIPEGYLLLDSTSGDLNRDQYTDMILVLKKPDEEKTSDVSEHPTLRPLLLLIGQSSHTYKLVARNDKVVECVDCGGMMGDPFQRVVIKKAISLLSIMVETPGDGQQPLLSNTHQWLAIGICINKATRVLMHQSRKR